MTKILIAGYRLDNVGDESILSGMVNSLKKHIPDADISVITNNPDNTSSLHNINTVEQSFKKGLPIFLVGV